MSKLRQFVVYAKLAIIGAMLIGVAVVVFMNRNNTTKFWPAAEDHPVSTLWLMLGTSVGSVIVFWFLTKMRRVFGEIAQLSQEKARESKLAEENRRRAELHEQEKRIDAKLKRSLDADNSQPAP